MKHFTPTTTRYDATLDVSEAWASLRDEPMECEDFAELLFRAESEYCEDLTPRGHGLYGVREYYMTAHTVVGMTVETAETGPDFMDRAEVERIFGADWVREMETYMDEVA